MLRMTLQKWFPATDLAKNWAHVVCFARHSLAFVKGQKWTVEN